MKRDGEHRASWWKRTTQVGLAAMVATVAAGSAGCLSRPINPLEPTTTVTEVEQLHQSTVDKIDILLMIDNSASMADKQSILSDAVSNLVKGLLNPRCVVPATDPVQVGPLPASPLDMCPDGYSREFNTVFDVHIGIISSSLGGHGSQSCSVADGGPANNDAGHLLDRGPGGGNVKTYNDSGFLAWDPKMNLQPAGISDLGTLSTTLGDLVTGTGQDGCGYEASLEAWYRFLVDPAPYTSIAFEGRSVVQHGKDETLLQQRADFMRADSLLAIIMLSDENDCSIKEYSFYPIVGNTCADADCNSQYFLPAATAQCKTDPTSDCCTSCGTIKADSECFAASKCQAGGLPSLDADTDPVNLRCFHNKQRYGIDFLYPIDRYTLALTQNRIPDPHASNADGTNTGGTLVENPIFTNISHTAVTTRTPADGLVFIAGIVGVPWQDISRDPKSLSKGFKNSEEMAAANIKVNGNNVSTWDVILGDPAKFKDPLDPHMIESRTARSGTDPIGGVTLVSPTGSGSDEINGHEWDTSQDPNGDLQYACIFDLPTPKDCSGGSTSCDCPKDTNPLCDTTDASSQIKAKGYPGIRELTLLKAVGAQGIVGSICPASLTGDTNDISYGYNAAVQGIIDRLKAKLGGACLAESFRPLAGGQVPCVIIEASKQDDCKAQCQKAGHSEVDEKNAQAVVQIKEDVKEQMTGYNCYCALDQAEKPADINACLNDKADPNLDVWCYVDAQVEKVEPSLVDTCPDDRKRTIRFLGGTARQAGTVYVTCSQ